MGDFVLTGGEIPAMAVADAVCRMVPGVLPDAECFEEEIPLGWAAGIPPVQPPRPLARQQPYRSHPPLRQPREWQTSGGGSSPSDGPGTAVRICMKSWTSAPKKTRSC